MVGGALSHLLAQRRLVLGELLDRSLQSLELAFGALRVLARRANLRPWARLRCCGGRVACGWVDPWLPGDVGAPLEVLRDPARQMHDATTGRERIDVVADTLDEVAVVADHDQR